MAMLCEHLTVNNYHSGPGNAAYNTCNTQSVSSANRVQQIDYTTDAATFASTPDDIGSAIEDFDRGDNDVIGEYIRVLITSSRCALFLDLKEATNDTTTCSACSWKRRYGHSNSHLACSCWISAISLPILEAILRAEPLSSASSTPQGLVRTSPPNHSLDQRWPHPQLMIDEEYIDLLQELYDEVSDLKDALNDTDIHSHDILLPTKRIAAALERLGFWEAAFPFRAHIFISFYTSRSPWDDDLLRAELRLARNLGESPYLGCRSYAGRLFADSVDKVKRLRLWGEPTRRNLTFYIMPYVRYLQRQGSFQLAVSVLDSFLRSSKLRLSCNQGDLNDLKHLRKECRYNIPKQFSRESSLRGYNLKPEMERMTGMDPFRPSAHINQFCPMRETSIVHVLQHILPIYRRLRARIYRRGHSPRRTAWHPSPKHTF